MLVCVCDRAKNGVSVERGRLCGQSNQDCHGRRVVDGCDGYRCDRDAVCSQALVGTVAAHVKFIRSTDDSITGHQLSLIFSLLSLPDFHPNKCPEMRLYDDRFESDPLASVSVSSSAFHVRYASGIAGRSSMPTISTAAMPLTWSLMLLQKRTRKEEPNTSSSKL